MVSITEHHHRRSSSLSCFPQLAFHQSGDDSGDLPVYEQIAGLRFPSFYPPHAVLSGLQYKPQHDDIFLITYPGCGTSWIQQILYLVLHQGQAPRDAIDLFQKFPLLELEGHEAVEAIPKPGAITSHLPYDYIPKSSTAKYVLLLRDPRDVCATLFDHVKGFPSYMFANGEFSDFFDQFCKDATDYGGYFNHVQSWWKHRSDPNVFFVTYEAMQQDLVGVVENLASFLGTNPPSRDTLGSILEKSSVQYMRDHTNKHMEEFFYIPMEKLMADTRLFEGLLAYHATVQCSGLLEAMTNVRCVRRGVSGRWKVLINAAQEQRIKDRTSQLGADVVDALWVP